jgi:lysophospholipase L1-like esterase
MIKVAVNGAKWRDTSENQQYDGNPIEDDKDNNVIGNQVQKVINNKGVNADYDDFDIIIIACGTNDIPKGGLNDEIALIPQQFFNGTTPISVDDVDRTTFGGAMRYSYDKLSNLYPNAKFFISTPIQGAYATRPYVDIKLVGDIEKAFCEYQSIQAIDTFNCGICGLYEVQGSQGKDLLDGLHPIKSGGKKMGYYIANAIKRYYDFN